MQGTISSGLENLTSLKHSISYNVLEGKLPTSFGRLREPRSISLSWANKSKEILEIFHSFSRGMFDGLEESYVVDCQIFGHLTDQISQLKISKLCI